MARVACPRCKNVVDAPTTQNLVCPTCNFPGADSRSTQWAPVQPPPPVSATGPVCPRCQGMFTKKGSIPVWAIVLAVVFCPLGLLFLLIKDENQCYSCGMQWK